jgi:hypothetical protein
MLRFLPDHRPPARSSRHPVQPRQADHQDRWQRRQEEPVADYGGQAQDCQ